MPKSTSQQNPIQTLKKGANIIGLAEINKRAEIFSSNRRTGKFDLPQVIPYS
jgi:hypothetical protein